jgi:large subunit ribosomal protein L21
MIAVIQTGGKQYLVREGQTLKIEKLEQPDGAALTFDALLIANDDGSGVQVGKPFVKGAKVEGKVMKQGRAKKIEIVKYKPKSRYRRHQGHRQHYTEIKVEKIG